MWKLVVLAVVVGVGAPPADACSCAGPRAMVFPRGAVATHAHLFVFVPEASFTTNMSPFALRLAGTKARLEVDESSTVATGLRLVELTPRAALTAKAKYEVVDASDKVIDTVEVTDRADPPPAPWKGIAKSEVLRYKHAGGGSCRSGSPFVRLAFAGASDPAVYAIWIAGKTGKLDYTRPPSTFDAGGTSLELGNHISCRLVGFPFPKGDIVKLGIVRIDGAGARSTPAEVTVDLRTAVDT